MGRVYAEIKIAMAFRGGAKRGGRNGGVRLFTAGKGFAG